MDFLSFLEKHYNAHERAALTALLKKHGLFDELQQLTDTYFGSEQPCSKPQPGKCFAQWYKKVMPVCLQLLQNIADDDHPEGTEILALHFLKNLTHQAILFSKLQVCDFLAIHAEILARQHNISLWNSFIFSVLTDTVEIKEISLPKLNEPDILLVKIPPLVYFTWNQWTGDKNNKSTFDHFLNDITTLFPGLNAIKKLGQLFTQQNKPYKIILPSRHLFLFMMIFNQLHISERISCENNRGLFMHIKNHITGTCSDALPACNDYAKLYHNMMKNTRIKNNVITMIEPLLLKFGTKIP